MKEYRIDKEKFNKYLFLLRVAKEEFKNTLMYNCALDQLEAIGLQSKIDWMSLHGLVDSLMYLGLSDEEIIEQLKSLNIHLVDKITDIINLLVEQKAKEAKENGTTNTLEERD